MKKILSPLIILAILLSSCKNDDPILDQTAVEMEVVTNNSNNTIEISLSGSTSFVDWGDGSQQQLNTASGVTLSHTYSTGAKAYTVKVTDDKLQSFGLEKNDDDIVKYVKFMQNSLLRFVRLLQAKSINSLDFSECPVLQELYITRSALLKLDLASNNSLQSVKLLSNPELTSLKLNNKLKILGLETNPKLSVNTLGLSQLISLEELFLPDMNLTDVDLSANVAIRTLDLSDNKLTSVNVSTLTKLKTLSCADNQLDALALNALYTSLPIRTVAEAANIDITGNPGSGSSNESLATAKNWAVTK